VTNVFTIHDAWAGGFYELALAFAPPADQALDTALKVLWNLPGLQGCYVRSDVEPSAQPRIPPSLTALESAGHLRGIATLPNGKVVACGTYRVPEEGGSDWLGFYLPLGSLSTAYDVGGYPFQAGPASTSWRQPLEEWLAAIGQAVFAHAAFPLGLVGFEVSGEVSPQELRVSGVPESRARGYLVPTQGQLRWYPTNQW
jgi:hypothetical protein